MQSLLKGFSRFRTNTSKSTMETNFGEMEVSSISSSGITMRNSDSISLSRGNTIDIMGKLSFIVADADELRFAPIVETVRTRYL